MELLDGASAGIRSVVGGVKNRVVEATTALFSHGPRPLEHTLEHAPDPGLLGPDSVSWRVIGDAAAFVGGIRALIVQTAHPEVVAGVEQHSRYRNDPLGRLTRTSFYVTETTYGAMPEVERSVEMVRRAHRPVRGRSERDVPYSAGQPEMAAWVHNVLTESFLAAYQAYGPSPLTPDEADRFVEEQTRIGALLDADPMPTTADALTAWVRDHPALDRTGDLRHAMEFLQDPPLSLPVKLGYRPLFNAAVATMPDRLRDLTGLSSPWRGRQIGRGTVNTLRWALGSSPSWHVSLVRVGAPVPDGLFRQPLSSEAKALLASRRSTVTN
jgi:uncharacterized protein (DUF2236 family)